MIARREDRLGQALVNPIVAQTHAKLDRYLGTVWINRSEGAQHAVPREWKRNRQPAWNRNDDGWMRGSVELAGDDLKTRGRPLLGPIDFAKQVYDRDAARFDVTAGSA